MNAKTNRNAKTNLKNRTRHFIFRAPVLLVAVLAVISIVTTSAAASPISLNETDWSSSGPGSHSASTTSNGDIEFDWDVGGYGNRNRWTYQTTAQATESLTFDWRFRGCHSWYRSDAKAYVFADGPSGTTQVLLSNTGWCTFNKAGTTTIQVHQGYAFGVKVTGYHFDGSKIMRGTFTLSIPNEPPKAALSAPASADEGASITLDASGSSDSDGSIASYAWDLDNDGQFDDAAGATTSTSFADDGTHTVAVRVTDDHGATDTASATVSVSNVAPAVTASVSPTAIDEASSSTLSVSYTDPGSADTHTATVDWGDGTVETLAASGGSLSASHVYADDGSYTVTATVTDDEGDSGTATATVSVSNVAPVLSADVDDGADEGDTVSASGSFTDVGVEDTHSVSIDWGDGTVESTSITQGAGTGSFAAGHVYADNGGYAVTVTVTDDDGGSSTYTESITVSNVAPSASMTLDNSGVEDQPVSLSAPFTDPGSADTHTATVDWGDGTIESVGVTQGAGSGSLSTTHTYATGGIFTVTLTVTDDDGGATTNTESITVTHVAEVDVKPGNGDETDLINPKSKGVIPVAIGTTAEFDASTVDVSSLRFGASSTVDGGYGATPAHNGHLEDVDGDGDLDLVVHFEGDTGLETGDEEVTVTGTTSNDVPLFGTDAVRVTKGNSNGGNGNGNNGNGNGGNGNGN